MPKRIGVLLIHGMGEQSKTFGVAWERRISALLDPNVNDDVHFGPVFYQGELQAQQADVWARMDLGNPSLKLPIALGVIWLLVAGAGLVLNAVFDLGLVLLIGGAIWLVVGLAGLYLASPNLWVWLRRFFLLSFSDATTYQHRPSDPASEYLAVHKIVRKAVE